MSHYKKGQIHMLADKLEEEGYTPEHLTKFGQFPDHGGLKLVLDGQAKIVPIEKSNDLLNFLSAVTVPATTKRFVAREKFVVNTTDNAPVKISYLGDNFREWFLAGEGKVEAPLPKQKLRYAKLEKSSVDGPIITELGGEAKAETMLSEVFALMAKQGNGKKGALLNNGWVNIFYVRDTAGVLRAVDVRWAWRRVERRCELRRGSGHVARWRSGVLSQFVIFVTVSF